MTVNQYRSSSVLDIDSQNLYQELTIYIVNSHSVMLDISLYLSCVFGTSFTYTGILTD